MKDMKYYKVQTLVKCAVWQRTRRVARTVLVEFETSSVKHVLQEGQEFVLMRLLVQKSVKCALRIKIPFHAKVDTKSRGILLYQYVSDEIYYLHVCHPAMCSVCQSQTMKKHRMKTTTNKSVKARRRTINTHGSNSVAPRLRSPIVRRQGPVWAEVGKMQFLVP